MTKIALASKDRLGVASIRCRNNTDIGCPGALPWDVWDSTKFFQFLLRDLEGVPLLEDSSVLFIEPTSVARSVLGDTRG